MPVRLIDFCSALIVERKVIRPNMGNSIVPLLRLRILNLEVCEDDYQSGYYGLHNGNEVLLTVCRRSGSIFAPRNLDSLYSAGSYVGYSDWWNRAEVVSLRSLNLLKSRIVEANIHISEVDNREPPW